MLSSQNMRGFDHATILSPSFHGLRKERQAQLCIKYDEKPRLGTSRNIGWGFAAPFLNSLPYFRPKSVIFPYSISHLIKNLIHYFRPEALAPGASPERVTSCYGTYTDIKREMVLSLNDEEVASSKKNTQFKTRVHKPYLFSDQNGRN